MKSLTAGSEIDAWCTRCRMDLGHRIVALVASRPKRVICQTCGSEHNYRAPKQVTSPARPRLRKANGEESLPAPPKAPRITQAMRTESDRVSDWQARVSGQSAGAFRRYKITERFDQNDLLLHPKFGQGYVVEVKDGDKVSVMFRDQLRLLAHGAR